MIRLLSRIAAALMAVSLVFLSPHAAALDVTATPATAFVAADRAAVFSVAWRLVNDTPATVTLTSAAGDFNPGLGSVPAQISRTLPPNTTALVTENVRVPQAVIQKALDAQLGSFTYRRAFLPTPPADVAPSATVTLVLTGGQAAGLAVSRQAIAFDDDSPARLVAPRQVLSAWSEITLTGSGLVEGVWEIAEPPGTSGQPVFRTLLVLRRFAQGGLPLRLDSPALPTLAPGLHLLRLRLTRPQPDFAAPEIRYFVAQPGAAPVARELRLLTPGPGALLEETTRFAWSPVDGARSWLLLLYERPATLAGSLPTLGAADTPEAAELAKLAHAQPAAGMVLPAERIHVALSDLARTRLKPATTYLWRVLGLGPEGAILAESPWRVIRTH